jgi:alpha-methylacyl-CoA racemase
VKLSDYDADTSSARIHCDGDAMTTGPLRGLRVVEMAGLGPAPFAAMMLADLGADVVRVDRPARDRATVDRSEGERATARARAYVPHRGRRSIALDLKSAAGRATAVELAARADVLIEGFRPGVMERLGLGPAECLARNPRLVYGRMTGWGQDGPLAQTAGHDIDYIAVAGALDNFRRHGERPVAPLNLVGDYGGGGMLLALGVIAAHVEVLRTGRGQLVDTAMVDGVAVLTALQHGLLAQGRWNDEPGTNFADAGSPYYDAYETADGRFVAVGALEAPFYAQLLEGLGLDPAELPDRDDEASWPVLKDRIATAIRGRTRDEWEQVFAGTDACVAPVLSLAEATRHPANTARGVFVDHHGVVQPAPAPRFSLTPAELTLPPPLPGEHTDEVLRDWGVEPPNPGDDPR